MVVVVAFHRVVMILGRFSVLLNNNKVEVSEYSSGDDQLCNNILASKVNPGIGNIFLLGY